jgi:hypothetical protein
MGKKCVCTATLELRNLTNLICVCEIAVRVPSTARLCLVCHQEWVSDPKMKSLWNWFAKNEINMNSRTTMGLVRKWNHQELKKSTSVTCNTGAAVLGVRDEHETPWYLVPTNAGFGQQRRGRQGHRRRGGPIASIRPRSCDYRAAASTRRWYAAPVRSVRWGGEIIIVVGGSFSSRSHGVEWSVPSSEVTKCDTNTSPRRLATHLLQQVDQSFTSRRHRGHRSANAIRNNTKKTTTLR